ncbi:podocalyxin-like protein 2 [Engraulis encrasicolus]|uniref:podocalyxin-like protein 2 n=1 Tax=Engraulis encrasicolus TaxID=184585 RepID=UPI002FCE87E0
MPGAHATFKLLIGSLLSLLVQAGSLRDLDLEQHLYPDLSHSEHHPYRPSSSSSSSFLTPEDPAELLTAEQRYLEQERQRGRDTYVRDRDPQNVPGFLDSSQESSGFYSEDSEENKPPPPPPPPSPRHWDSGENRPPQPQPPPQLPRHWDVQEHQGGNGTDMDTSEDTLLDDGHPSLHPNSSSPPSGLPASRSLSLSRSWVGEGVDMDAWETDGESSGTLSPTDAAPVALSPVTDTSDEGGPLLGHRGEQAWLEHPESAAAEGDASEEQQGGEMEAEDGDGDENEDAEAGGVRRGVGVHGNMPVQMPTTAEMGPVPTRSPLQPEVFNHDDMEMEEEEEEEAEGKEEGDEDHDDDGDDDDDDDDDGGMIHTPIGGEEDDDGDDDDGDDDNDAMEEDREEERAAEEREWLENHPPHHNHNHHHTPLTTVPSSSVMPAVVFTQMPWQHAGGPMPGDRDRDGKRERERESELRRGGLDYMTDGDLLNAQLSQDTEQVTCVEWSDLAGKGYVILNMTDNFDCEEFRVESGDRLLEMLESSFSRKMSSPQDSWYISLSKPTRTDHQLLMTLASQDDVIPTKDVLSMLGEIRRGLREIGIQNYSSASSCHARPSQTRSDYGKLFVVLVIIGSVCVVIIASGLIYICWQRRLPKMKNMSRGEELHFVENGCHDNPTLDVTSDSQSELQEKKSSANGVPVGGGGSGGWQILVNKNGKEEPENMEEDTHL